MNECKPSSKYHAEPFCEATKIDMGTVHDFRPFADFVLRWWAGLGRVEGMESSLLLASGTIR